MASLTLVLFRDGSSASDAVAVLRDIVRTRAGHYAFTEIDVQDRPELAVQYNVRTTPTTLLVKNGDMSTELSAHRPRPLCTTSSTHGRCTPRVRHRLGRGAHRCRIYRRRGPVVAKNIQVERRFAAGRSERVPGVTARP